MGGGTFGLAAAWIVAENLLLKKNIWMKIQKLHKFA